MRRSGRIPPRIWNALVDATRESALVSVCGGKLRSGKTGKTLVLDPPQGGGGVSAPDHPWKPYTPPWTGEGERPADWGLRVKLIPGTVGNRLPGNWNDVFTLDAEAEAFWVYLEVAIDQRGYVLSSEIKKAVTPPLASEPTPDGAIPGILYVALFSYDSTELAVTRVYQSALRNLQVIVDVTEPGCHRIYRRVTVGAA